MPKPIPLNFPVWYTVPDIPLAECPISDELDRILDHLGVCSLGRAGRVTLQELRELGDQTGAWALELGSLIRRAERGEFGRHHEPSRFLDAWGSLPISPFRNSKETLKHLKTNPRERGDYVFSIPEKAHGLRFSDLPMSARLQNALCRAGLDSLGELDGATDRNILGLCGFGPRSVEELREIVRLVQEGSPLLQPPPDSADGDQPVRRFMIAKAVLHLSPYQFPMSRRLDGALRRAGIACLDDLEGMDHYRLLRMNGCSRGTLKELLQLIKRAEGGA